MPVLTWIGKDKVINHHHTVPYRVLEAQYTHGGGDGNMIIHGDNLDALKSLLPRYEGRVKCVYIDPPYNTGNERWVYNDNVKDPRMLKWLGEVVGKEGEDLSRHDKWLCMMYPRLRLLQQLLADDGAIFISIDDNEQANLKLICDEIFGAGNFVAVIACINNPKGRSDSKYFATSHESILVYKKSNLFKVGGFDLDGHITKRYNKKDENGSVYREIDLRKTGENDERTDRPNMFYPFWHCKKTNHLSLIEPIDKTYYVEILPFKSQDMEGCWRWGRDTAMEKLSVLFARYMPMKKQWSVFEKDYLENRNFVKPTTHWDFKDVNSERGTETFVKYLCFEKNDFEKPKPVGTVERILQIATNPGDIILDSFAGSGTTAHAVLKLNREHRGMDKPGGGDRRFILVEMEDYAETITAERVRRVIDGVGDTDGIGGGFTFYELGDRLLLENGNLNEEIGEDKIRAYIWYTETRSTWTDDAPPPYLGKHGGTAYYFHYKKDALTVLDRAFLRRIRRKAERYVVYADKNTLSDSECAAFRVVFKKIPRDIARL